MRIGHDIGRFLRLCGPRRLALAAVLTAALPLPDAGAQQSADILGAQDKLRIKVVEWRAGEGRYHEWEVMTGEYVIGGDGKLILPLIGAVPAAGETTATLSASIADRLQERASLINRPEPSVEIIEHQPIYVTGEVDRPGQVQYRSGITVLQAVSVAGGLYRRIDGGLLRLERDRIAAAGTLESARRELWRLEARQARLDAEARDEEKVATPATLDGVRDAEQLMDEERQIFETRREGLRSKLAALDELRKLLEGEGVSLARKLEVQQRQIDLARRELGDVGKLVEKGLAVSSRQFTLERTAADVESRLLDLETSVLRVKQDIAKAERDALDLRTDRQAKVAAERQENLAAIDQAKAKRDMAAALVDEATELAPMLALDRWRRDTGTAVYTVMRSVDGRIEEKEVSETTVLRPGDLVRVGKVSAAADAPELTRAPAESRAAREME